MVTRFSSGAEIIEFVGVDIGHGESAVSYLKSESEGAPKRLEIAGDRSILSVVGDHPEQGVLIGEAAVNESDMETLWTRFKSRHLGQEQYRVPMEKFAAAIVQILDKTNQIRNADETRFIVGHPSAWNKEERKQYAELLNRAGMKNVEMMAESRAAFLSAREDGELKIEAQKLAETVLIIDVGSSTTDFTVVSRLQERPLEFGNNELGAGWIDELILSYLVTGHDRSRDIQIALEDRVFRRKCELLCRRVKQKYFDRPGAYKKTKAYGGGEMLGRGLTFNAAVNASDMEQILNTPIDALVKRTFAIAFEDELISVRNKLEKEGLEPNLVLLTGGASRMDFTRKACESVFPNAKLVRGKEPEFAISDGLALAGRMDLHIGQFRAEVEDLIGSGQVKGLVEKQIDSLIDEIAEPIADKLSSDLLMPELKRWADGSYKTLRQATEEIARKVESWLESKDGQVAIQRVLAEWFARLSPEIEHLTHPICKRYRIDTRSFQLSEVVLAIKKPLDPSSIRGIYDDLAATVVTAVALVVSTVITIVSSTITLGLASLVVFVVNWILGAAIASKIGQGLVDANVPKMLRKPLLSVSKNKLRELRPKLIASITSDLGKGTETRDKLITSVIKPVVGELQRNAKEVELLIE